MSITLLELPVGITNPVYAEDSVEFIEFKKVCYEVSRSLGLKVHNLWKCMESKTERKGFTYDNYHLAHFGDVLVYCNSGYPYIGIVGSSLEHEKPFIDNHDMSNYFSMSGRFQVLGAQFLNSSFVIRKKDIANNKLFSKLDEGEIRDILLWKPDVIGQVIFNDWD